MLASVMLLDPGLIFFGYSFAARESVVLTVYLNIGIVSSVFEEEQ